MDIRSKFDSLLDFHSDKLTPERLERIKDILESRRDERNIASLSLSIGDGGVSFTIKDTYGPTLVISSSHFGNNVHKQEMSLTVDALTKLRELFEIAEKAEYSDEYVYPLKAYGSPTTPEQRRQDEINSEFRRLQYRKESLAKMESEDKGFYSHHTPERLSQIIEEEKKDILQSEFDLEFLHPSAEELEIAYEEFKQEQEERSSRHSLGTSYSQEESEDDSDEEDSEED